MKFKKINIFYKLIISLILFTTFFMASCHDNDSNDPDNSDWAKTSIFYQIFVRSFYDSNGDGTGDLKGVEQKLDYLNDLGVDAIWMNPIHPSQDYHGYTVKNYKEVNPDFGTIDDFKNLIRSAHEKNIKVVIDFVVNHTSSEHDWFVKALENDSLYKSFYRWNGSAIDGNWGLTSNGEYCYYSFGPQSYMPDLNYDEPLVRETIKETAKYWLDLGVDGFRLDVAQYIGDGDDAYSVEWWKEFKSYVKSINPKAYIVGEVNYDGINDNTKIAPYYQGMDSAFNFPAYNQFVVTAAGLNVDFLDTIKRARDEYEVYSENFNDTILIGNHDRTRIASELNFNVAKIKKAITLVMTMPGTPSLYYGDEIGMRGGHDLQGDPHKREPFDWYTSGTGTGMTEMNKAVYGADSKNIIAYDGISLEEQKNNENSIYEYYKKIIRIKKTHPMLFDGKYQRIGTIKNTYGYKVSSKSENYSLYVIHNQSLSEEKYIEIKKDNVTELISNTQYNTGKNLTIPIFATVILKSEGQGLPIDLLPIEDNNDENTICKLTIKIHVPENTPADAILYMPNSDDGWNPTDITANPECIATKINDSLYEISVERLKGTRMEYKFFRGSWETSETDINGDWTGNRVHLFVDSETIVDATIPGWRDTNYSDE